jgi:F0F1-type ATP synthase assembly protein I
LARRGDPGEDGAGRPEGPVPYGWFRMYAVVLEFLAYIGGFGVLGYWLDQRNAWTPWGLLVGLLAGTGFGLYRLLREAKRFGLW